MLLTGYRLGNSDRFPIVLKLFFYPSENALITQLYYRTNSSKVLNEFSLLTWTSEKDRYGGSYTQPFNISGYISDVAYFTIKTHVYVVICRYYDPVLDTHNLDCTVIRISRMTVGVISLITWLSSI